VRLQVKAVLVQAARLQQVKLTGFTIKSAQVAAEMALADGRGDKAALQGG
jgi:uncharacterized protein (DUF1778 family)